MGCVSTISAHGAKLQRVGGNSRGGGEMPALQAAFPALRGVFPALRGAFPALQAKFPHFGGSIFRSGEQKRV